MNRQENPVLVLLIEPREADVVKGLLFVGMVEKIFWTVERRKLAQLLNIKKLKGINVVSIFKIEIE